MRSRNCVNLERPVGEQQVNEFIREQEVNAFSGRCRKSVLVHESLSA